ncbi:MAG: glycosyl transferase family 2 [Clostridia bacterium]|nr:glycosyl transferase family 2 [Clostridia bacterium]
MNRWLNDILHGREDNFMLPFYWQHGDHYEKIPEQIERILSSGCRAFCVESRPHPDFCGETWWRDMDRILAEAEKRGMQVWLLDDDHFPTGHAAGRMKDHPDLRKWQLTERHVDVMGPLSDALLLPETPDEEHELLEVYAYPRADGGEECLAEPIRLTEGMCGKFLQFSVPAGCHRVFFLYKTRGGSQHPDYVDMLREDSVRVLIDTVYESHYRRYARYFGTTFAGFFSDEPCLANTWEGEHATDKGMYDRRVGMPGLALPWNERVTGMMRDALGFDPAPLLPALWFDFGTGTGELRHAYMDAVTRLYRDCFTRQLGDWCRDHGVMYIGHIIEDMNAHARLGCSAGHYFRALDGQHMSGMDIVLHQLVPGMAHYIHTATAFGNNADPAFYDYVLAKLCSSLAHIGVDMQNRAMCEVFGAYGWAEGAPTMKWLLDHLLVRGVNHFVPHAFSSKFPDPDCPPHFGAEGQDPQFEAFSKLMTYGNKVAHLLYHARLVADAAILYHADAEWSNEYGDAMLTQAPAKILYDAHIDYDILPADCFLAESGARLFPAKAENGALRVGDRRYGCLIVPWAKALPERLAAALGRIEEAGVPVIYMKKNETAEGLLAAADGALERDILVAGDHPLLRCAHFVSEQADIYMFFNESVCDPAKTAVMLPAVKDADGCLILDLLNDSVYTAPVKDGEISLSLAPYQSVLAVFDRDRADIPALPAQKTLADAGDALLNFRIETAPYTDLERFTTYAESADARRLPNITDIQADPEFSGKIRYTCTFDASDGVCGIDLGEVGQTTHLWLNGVDLGVRVCKPYRYDLSGALKPGKNELVIEVSNTLANAVRDWFSCYLAIPASGLIGPVRWLREAEPETPTACG